MNVHLVIVHHAVLQDGKIQAMHQIGHTESTRMVMPMGIFPDMYLDALPKKR